MPLKLPTPLTPAKPLALQPLTKPIIEQKITQLTEQAAAPSTPAKQEDKPSSIKYQEVSDKITELEQMLLANHPKMPTLLHEIWLTLKQYPECVVLLSEDQVEKVVAGLEKQVDTDLASISLQTATKGKKGSGKDLTNASLGF